MCRLFGSYGVNQTAPNDNVFEDIVIRNTTGDKVWGKFVISH